MGSEFRAASPLRLCIPTAPVATCRVSGSVLGTMAVALLEDWCRIVNVEDQKSLMVTGIRVNCDEAEIQVILQETLKSLGRYRLLGKMFRKQENANAVLLELMEDVDVSVIPSEIQGKGGVWKVIFKTPNQDTEFLERLNLFLEKEGQTVSGMFRALGHHGYLRPQYPAYLQRYWPICWDRQWQMSLSPCCP